MDYEIIDRGWNDYQALVKELASKEIAVGLHEGSKSSNGQSLPVVAASNEYGTKRIPSRGFMRKTAAIKRKNAFRALERGYIRIVNKAPIIPTLQQIGDEYSGYIKGTIDTWTAPPNKPSTIRKKGRNSPLRDTYTMRNSVKAVVRRRRWDSVK